MAGMFPGLEQIERLTIKPTDGELRLLKFLEKSLDSTYEVYYISKRNNKNVNKNLEELVYTGITRARKNLIFISIGSHWFDCFFKQYEVTDKEYKEYGIENR